MSNKISNYSKKVFDLATKNMREDFNRKVLDATFKAQKNMVLKLVMVNTVLGIMMQMLLNMHIYRGI